MSETTTDETEPCYCCGSQDVDPGVFQCFCSPICDNCLKAEDQSPVLANPDSAVLSTNQYWYAKRNGRWYLEMYVHATGREGPLAEVDTDEVDVSKAPTEEDVIRLSGLGRL